MTARSAPLLCLLLAACGAGPALEPTLHATLALDRAFDQRPWAEARPRPRPGPLRTTARFTLPPDRVGPGSELILEGLWWRATVTVNGQALPPVTGGNATARVPVGAALKPGENVIAIEVHPPSGQMPIETGGGLASSSFQQQQPTLQAPPTLELQPEAHVDWATVRAADGQVVPSAQVSGAGAGAGAVVRFVVVDGDTQHDLGSAPVDETGRATGAAVDWPLDWWAPGAPALYALHASLEREGAAIDRRVSRVGARAVEAREKQLWVNGAPHLLVGARITNRPDLGDLPERLGPLLPAGINALEIHGELPRSTWLDLTDEVGLPVALVPRCVGRTRRGSTPTEASWTLQRAQDDRFNADLADRPSVLLWVGEGPAPRTQRGAGLPLVMWTDQLLQDPVGRPIVQHHLPDRFLQTQPAGPDGVVHHSCEREPCSGTWLVEVTWEGPTVPEMWPAMAGAFSESIGVGALGGIVPTPERHDTDKWLAAMQPMIAGLGVEPPTPGPHRGKAIVAVAGGPPGETAWLSSPGAGTVGAVVAADGTARLELWADGDGTLQIGTEQRAVSLQPTSWTGLERSAEQAAVTW